MSYSMDVHRQLRLRFRDDATAQASGCNQAVGSLWTVLAVTPLQLWAYANRSTAHARGARRVDALLADVVNACVAPIAGAEVPRIGAQ